MRGPARTTLEMGFAVSMAPCANCGRHDVTRYDVRGEGTTWTLAGHCAHCHQGRNETFRTLGNPYKARLPMGELGEGPTQMFTAAELRADLANVEQRLATDPKALPRADWPEELASNQHALLAATELRKLGAPDADEAFARHIGVLRAYEAERERVMPAKPTAIGEITRATVMAHEQWVARGRTGAGRLVISHVDAKGERIGNVNLTAARIDGALLDDAGMAFIRLDEAELTEVSFVGANLDDATFSQAQISGGSFERAQLAVTRFDSVTITGTDFTKADLERSDWKGAHVTRATFAGVRFGNATIDGATFASCDFREARFGVLQRLPVATTASRFEDCDLRDTDWTGRSLDGATFVRCKLAGAHGKPSTKQHLTLEDCDLTAEQFP